MKKYVLLLFILLTLSLLASCQKLILSTTNTARQETILKEDYQAIGLRITYNRYTDHPTYDYFYNTGHPTSPYITDLKITQSEDRSGKAVVHYEFNLHQYQCGLMQTIMLNSHNEFEYRNNIEACAVSAIGFGEENNDVTIYYKINFKNIDKLISYQIIEYDINNDKINTQEVTLLGGIQEITLHKATEFFKVIKQYQNDQEEMYTEKSLYSVESNSLQEIVYTIQNDHRMYIQMNFQREE